MTTWVLVLYALGASPSQPIGFASMEACELAGRRVVATQPRRQEYGWRCVEVRRT